MKKKKRILRALKRRYVDVVIIFKGNEMSRIKTPAQIKDAPEASQELLGTVQNMLGSVPNMFRIISNSPAVLEGYLGLSAAISKGKLSAATRERIALAVAQVNGCDYCLAAHTYLAQNVAKLNGVEIDANRAGTSTDAKAAVAVSFAVEIARSRGQIDKDAIAVVKDAGFSDEEIVEIIGNVALNVLTNYVNEVLDTEIDFPATRLAKAA